MNKSQLLFLDIIKKYVRREKLSFDIVSSINDAGWDDLVSLSSKQGLSAVVADVLEYSNFLSGLPQRARISFLLLKDKIERRYQYQFQIASEIAQLFYENNIRTLVLKGLVCSSYYHDPKHRVGGDFDCYLCGDYDKGNLLFKNLGASVNCHDYKHSSIKYAKLLIENHRFCIPFRGNRELGMLEKHLESLAVHHSNNWLGTSHLEIPTPDFNALFLMAHQFHHFLAEGIRFRQILDWALFLQKEHRNIDWKQYDYWMKLSGMKVYSDTINFICIKYLGVSLENTEIPSDSKYVDRILYDVFCVDHSLFNKGYIGASFYFHAFINSCRDLWKYHAIYRHSLLMDILRKLPSRVLCRIPKL